MTTPPRAATPPRPRQFDRLGLYIIVICGAMALGILAWAVSLPDGITS